MSSENKDGRVYKYFPLLLSILDELHISNTAKKHGISQPSVSKVLKMCQSYYKDELIFKYKSEYKRTSLGQYLYRELQKLKDQLRIIEDPINMDIGKTQKNFKISGTDFEFFTLISPIINNLFKVTPHSTLNLVHTHREVLDKLSAGELDIAFWTIQPPSNFNYLYLCKDEVVCLMKKDIYESESITFEKYCEYEHVKTIHPVFENSIVESYIATKSLKRSIKATTNSFFTSASLADSSNLIATMPYKFAMKIKTLFSLEISRFSEPIFFDYYLIWDEKTNNNYEIKWLIEFIFSQTRALNARLQS
jgi:DNA-binding transcriptional LysR family regulator